MASVLSNVILSDVIEKKKHEYSRHDLEIKHLFCQVSEQFDEIRMKWSLKTKWHYVCFLFQEKHH